jgi:hypothetical protein
VIAVDIASDPSPMPSRSVHPASLLCAILALAAGGARATDVATVEAPVRLADNAVQIGSRTVRLPAGRWTLVHVKDFKPVLAHDFDITTAWVVLLRQGKFGMAMQLSMPVGDLKRDHPPPDNPCTARDGVLRGDYSHGQSDMECLAVFGHHDLQAILAQRSPRTAKWLANRGVPKVDDGVEFTYAHREGRMLGRVAFYFPAQDFASDDEAAAWAASVRQAFEPLIERKVGEIDVPPLPAPVPAQP